MFGLLPAGGFAGALSQLVRMRIRQGRAAGGQDLAQAGWRPAMRPWLLVLGAVGQVLGSVAFGKDPFSVDAKIRASGTGTVLAVSFTVPEQHHLYAEQMKVEAVG